MDKRCLPAAVAAAALALGFAAPHPAALAASLDERILDELNFARTDPAAYARMLEAQAQADRRDPAGETFAYEDPDALQEALDFLREARPLAPLRYDPRLAAAARAHAAAHGPTGGAGHVGP